MKNSTRRFRRCLSLLLGVLPGFFAPLPAHAAEALIGIASKVSTIEIKDRSSGDTAASMSDRYRPTPVFSIKTRDRYWNDTSSWGGFVEFSEGYVKADRQRVAGDLVEMGTVLSAIYWHLTPTVFYNFRRGSANADWGFRVGVGVGLGYMDVSGDAILTNTPGRPRVEFDDEAYTYTFGMFFETSKNDWVLQLKNYGPVMRTNGFELSNSNVSLSFGKRFQLD